MLDFLPFLFFYAAGVTVVDVFSLTDDDFDITFIQKTFPFFPLNSIYSKFKVHCWPDAR